MVQGYDEEMGLPSLWRRFILAGGAKEGAFENILRILLIANFGPDQQESMFRFCELLKGGLAGESHVVDVLRPKPFFASSFSGLTALRKWVGYVDKFLLFPFVLRSRVGSYDVIHICDHSNAMYTRFLRGKPNLVTCHDLMAVRSALGEIPENPTGWSGRILQRAILRGLRRAQIVACVSEHTRRAVVRLARRDEFSTPCIQNGLNYPYSPMGRPEAWERAQPLLGNETRPFFLHVGGNQWYKNRPGLLRIFSHLRARGAFSRHLLVMVGKPLTSAIRTFIAENALGEDVVELVSLPNEDLRALYSLAEGLIFPSLDEGFGWPIAEAQACGCPVFTSNRPPMTEIGGSAAVYFDPCDPAGASEAIAARRDGRLQMIEHGLENARRFGAEKMLRLYMEVYSELSGLTSQNRSG
jgi:glycosyltransferase involved in cell wall biosynthesis